MISSFIQYITYRNFTVEHIKKYKNLLNDFAEIRNLKNIEEIKLEDVPRYLEFVSKGNFSINTIYNYTSMIKKFLEFHFMHNKLKFNPALIPLPKKERKAAKFLTKDEFLKVIKIIDLKSVKGPKDAAVLHSLFSTGCRASELASINKADLRGDEITIRGKGGKYRIVFLSRDAKKAIDRYLKTRTDSNPWLFQDCHGKRMSRQSINRIFIRIKNKNPLNKDFTAHTQRHSCATHLLKRGANLKQAQDILGHANVSTTSYYLHVTHDELKNVHKSIFNRKL